MKYPVLIDGEMKLGTGSTPVFNPADQSVVGELPQFNAQEMVALACASAKKAFPTWQGTSATERKALIRQFRKLLSERSKVLVEIMVQEIAKNRGAATDEIKRSLEYIDGTLAIFDQEFMEPMVIGEDVTHIKGKVGKFYRIPRGVVAAIAPFNYPVNLLLSKVIPALLTGNTVVYKGASQGSLSAAYISQIFYDAGFPKGVVNCLVGPGAVVGDLLTKNPLVDMIAFTGGTKVGEQIINHAPGKQLLLELGGKDPALVLDDANVEEAAKQIVWGALSYNGQRCTAIKRVLVSKTVHADLLQKINQEVAKLRVGRAEDNAFITPMISQHAVRYLEELVADAQEKGADLQQAFRVEGNLVYPLVIDQVTRTMEIAWEEQFGPVIPIIEYADMDEAIELINASEYGLQASIFTQNMEQATVLAKAIEAGTVNINRSSSRGPDIFPFSGVKHSGLGIQGLRDALYAMTKVKGIVFNQ